METQLSNDELTQVNGGGPDWGSAVKVGLIAVGLVSSPAAAFLGATYYTTAFAMSFGSSVPQEGDTPDPPHSAAEPTGPPHRIAPHDPPLSPDS